MQAPERWYYWAAEVLAAHGYVVMTFDVQGQGRSDATGTHDEHAFDGAPAQDLGHFVEDLQDALDFFTSTPGRPYAPRSPGAAELQRGDVAAKRATAWNPLAAALDASRIGIVGHSLAASAVSVLQGRDSRVDALVAWDNLSASEGAGDLSVTPRVPALGMSADYGLVAYPNASDPDPGGKGAGYARWVSAGVDAMEVVVRGGTHFEWSYSPSPVLPASERGIDMAAWYTTAWLDKYVKGDPTADRRLLTTRWQHDPVDAAIDPDGAGNVFSFYYRSPVHVHAAGTNALVACDDLRAGCPALGPDGGAAAYSFLSDRG